MSGGRLRRSLLALDRLVQIRGSFVELVFADQDFALGHGPGEREQILRDVVAVESQPRRMLLPSFLTISR